MQSAIRYLKRNQINNEKWNACIDVASNGLIYGYTFYLDAMCTAWDALVLEDYSAVMPLPQRKKWSIFYLYHPFAVAQLGLFGRAIDADLLYGFLKKIPPLFRYWDMPLNYGNVFDLPALPLYMRKNYVLSLQQPYEKLKAGYRPFIIRNVKKAVAQQCHVEKNIAVDIVITLAQLHKANWGTVTDYEQFKKLYEMLVEKDQAITYAVKAATGAILAAAVFFFSHQRVYYILPGNHVKSKQSGASHLLLDRFIQDYAGQNLLLDFEGSDVPGLQFFYSSFGAVEEPYAAIRYNRLPRLLKWLK